MSNYTEDYADDAALPHVNECPDCKVRDVGTIEKCKAINCKNHACELCIENHGGLCLNHWAEDGHIDDCAGWTGEPCDCAVRLRDKDPDDLPDEASGPDDFRDHYFTRSN